eukprot:comp18996_c0_seq1/m.34986 comp18996_c0_seq1/g.34986  ORF comp18996_c0_seq1/g.34986 comp18996_c0_seq1/m.34986 type:complete len:548 (+) comp18996_c0_seq1:194-1837(+)
MRLCAPEKSIQRFPISALSFFSQGFFFFSQEFFCLDRLNNQTKNIRSYKAQKKDGKTLTCDKHWHNKIEKYLNEGGKNIKYRLVAREVMGAIHIVAFLRNDPALVLSDVETSSEATGVLSVGKNKGGVMISFGVSGTYFTFIGSHLAAHQAKIAERNSDYKEIIEGLRCSISSFDATNLSHHTFWMGDLNYRIDVPRELTMGLIKQGDLATLYESDQLNIERRNHRVFVGFDEAPIHFNPTYKYERGNRVYTEEKQRIPSWCDRILWKSLPESSVHCLTYEAADEVTTSDHSPVFGLYDCTAKLGYDVYPGERKAFRIKISNLRGTGLVPKDVNTSDPYVKFRAPYFAADKFKTKVINSTLNPVWSDDKVPTMETVAVPVDFVRDNPVLVAVLDKDLGTSDDKMGQCAISLRNAYNNPVQFEIALLLGGFPAGVLMGTIVFYDANAPEPSLAQAQPASGPNLVPLSSVERIGVTPGASKSCAAASSAPTSPSAAAGGASTSSPAKAGTLSPNTSVPSPNRARAASSGRDTDSSNHPEEFFYAESGSD